MNKRCECSETVAFAGSCVDYRAYRYPLEPTHSAQHHARLRSRLMRLGRAAPERMGVTYVHGPWGHLVIPKKGFPELRVSFFHDADAGAREAVLQAICKATGNCRCQIHPTNPQQHHDCHPRD